MAAECQVRTEPEREWLYRPSSVAVLGASRDPRKLGHRLIVSLRAGGFRGAVYPINPAGGVIAGIPALTSTRDLPSDVELVVLAVPARHVLDSVRDLAGTGVCGVVVIASGFGETSDGAAMEAALARQAAVQGIRVVGPNTEGVIDFSSDFVCSYGSGFVASRHPARVAVISQSGGFTGQIYRLLEERGIACSRIVSSGNECDLTTADYLADAADDGQIAAVLLYMESVRQGRRLLDVLAKVSARKPVVVVKAGRTAAGAVAAISHTGAVAGDPGVVRGVLGQFGAVLAGSVDELADCAVGAVQLRAARCSRSGVAVLSQSGGAAVEMADLLDEAGVPTPQLAPGTQRRLQEHVPSYGAVGNPIDLTASVLENPALVGRSLEIVGADPAIGSVVLCLTDASNPALWDGLVRARDVLEVPVVLAWLGGRAEQNPGWRLLRDTEWPRVLSGRGAVSALRTINASSSRLVEQP